MRYVLWLFMFPLSIIFALASTVIEVVVLMLSKFCTLPTEVMRAIDESIAEEEEASLLDK